MKTKKTFDPDNWDWYAYLEADEKEKLDNFSDAWKKSNDWVTCACGERCKNLPKHTKESFEGFPGEPIYHELSDYGIDFSDYIKWKFWNQAKITLDKIEVRTSELLKLDNHEKT